MNGLCCSLRHCVSTIAMERLKYLAAFSETMNKNYPDKEKRTIENFLDTFALLPPLYEESRNCISTAEEYREKGNIVFNIGSAEDAALLYTQSLREAPPYSKLSALGYANRSAALHSLKAYKECISDIDRALDLPCPDDVRSALNLEKESAVAHLNKVSNNSNPSSPIDDLKFVNGENSKLPGVSNGIEIVYTSEGGSKLVAKTSFKSGDLLVVQNPYLPVTILDEDPAYCHHCLKKSLCLIPCEQCDYEVYCSEKCRSDAYENYHRIECKIQFTLRTSFPLKRQELVCLLRYLNIFTEQGNNLNAVWDDLKEIEDNSDPAKLGFTGDKFIGNTRKAFLSLLFGKEIKPNCDYMFTAGYIVTLLRNHTNFFKKNSDILLGAKLLIKLNNVYSSNQFVIPYSDKFAYKAHAIYPLISLANHACVNNTISSYDKDGRLVLRALQSIRPGDEIMWSYRVQFSISEIVSRSGRSLVCKRQCKQCDKTFSYPPEKPENIKVDQRLRNKLRKNPYDIEGLWKLLNILRGKHQRYTIQAQMVRLMLENAYEGRCDHEDGSFQLHMLGIL